jgi:ABC-type nickel/cobalt efflux system permease component RcnA
MKIKNDWMFWILLLIFILGIALLIKMLFFGGSPTLEEFNFALIILFGGLMLHLYREVGVIKNDCKHNFSNIRHSFDNLKEDMNLIKKRLNVK